MKLDIQGSDLEVFAGAADEAAHVVGVLTEASLLPLYEGAPSWPDTIRVIGGAGFAAAGVFPVATDVATARLVEVDLVFVRPAAASPAAASEA